MIEPLPTRNVARFMLPLADVMTLLFSLFLLLPHTDQSLATDSADAVSPGSLWTPDEQQLIRRELERLRRLVELPPGERLYTVTLEIDGDTGDLFVRQGDRVVRVTEQNLESIIEGHRLEAGAEQKLFYLLRRKQAEATFHPTIAEVEMYRTWLRKRGVASGLGH